MQSKIKWNQVSRGKKKERERERAKGGGKKGFKLKYKEARLMSDYALNKLAFTSHTTVCVSLLTFE